MEEKEEVKDSIGLNVEYSFKWIPLYLEKIIHVSPIITDRIPVDLEGQNFVVQRRFPRECSTRISLSRLCR